MAAREIGVQLSKKQKKKLAQLQKKAKHGPFHELDQDAKTGKLTFRWRRKAGLSDRDEAGARSRSGVCGGVCVVVAVDNAVFVIVVVAAIFMCSCGDISIGDGEFGTADAAAARSRGGDAVGVQD